MRRLRLGVVGVGHLGKEHARILSSLPGVELVGVADPRPDQVRTIAERCGTSAFPDYRQLLPRIEAAVVAVPTSHHHAIAADLLRHGISLLVEKPLTNDVSQADELVGLAERHSAILQVGHVERFNPAFEELQRRPLRPKYVTCERYGGFSGRSTDVGAVLDLMIHDLDLVLALVRSPVRSVEALGISVLGGHEDVAQARVTFADGCVADFSASRVHPGPVRRMSVWGPEGFASIDFGRRHLTLAQPAETLRQGRLDSRRLDPATLAAVKRDLFGGFIEIQELDCDQGDQLTAELEEFLHCIRSGKRPRVDGVAGRDAVVLAARVLDSLRSHAWEGNVDGPKGPYELSAPRGSLLNPWRGAAA
jgi:predicted dehydrogenase